ncbi:MAG: hypothetical protein HY542_06130 [Deltaproteobacteria bacterium]|nr:hypothetical protein [Deltaproteobacteria bacterium]
MSIFQVFNTAPLTLRALERATENATKLQENIVPSAGNLLEISRGIHSSRSFWSIVFFGPGTWDLRNIRDWRESREISLRCLVEFRRRGELVATHLVQGGIAPFLPNGVSRRFRELDRFILEAGGGVWSFGRSAGLLDASIGRPPTDEILQEAGSLLREVKALTSPRVSQLLDGIHEAIAIERENVSRSLFHARLAVGGICAALLVGFSVCAYFLSRNSLGPAKPDPR